MFSKIKSIFNGLKKQKIEKEVIDFKESLRLFATNMENRRLYKKEIIDYMLLCLSRGEGEMNDSSYPYYFDVKEYFNGLIDRTELYKVLLEVRKQINIFVETGSSIHNPDAEHIFLIAIVYAIHGDIVLVASNIRYARALYASKDDKSADNAVFNKTLNDELKWQSEKFKELFPTL
jgi:hypothetical protein